MIVTVTPNPSIDRTVTLPAQLVRGAVHRVQSVSTEPGGKGVNVARALTLAGLDTVAVLPAGEHDPIVAALHVVRGAVLRGAHRRRGAHQPDDHRIRRHHNEDQRTGRGDRRGGPGRTDRGDPRPRGVGGHWVVLSGSLPPGMPDSWYADMVAQLQPFDCKVAVDTSDAPLAALAAGFGRAAPDLIKPNSEELAGLAGVDPAHLETALAQGDPDPVVNAARQLIERGARHGAGHPRCGGRGAGQRDRQLAGHPSPDQAQEHRRRR